MEKKTDVDSSKDVISSQRGLLCLKCRLPGHCVKDCPQTPWLPELLWTFMPHRKLFNVGGDSETTQARLCERCRVLNIADLLDEDIEWQSRAKLNSAASKGSPHFRTIGKTGSIQYWSNCPLCLCLFSLTPNPSSEDQDVVIFPYWTIFRLEGGVIISTDEQRRYAKCLIVTLEPSEMKLEFDDRSMRGDALCFPGRGFIEGEQGSWRT